MDSVPGSFCTRFIGQPGVVVYREGRIFVLMTQFLKCQSRNMANPKEFLMEYSIFAEGMRRVDGTIQLTTDDLSKQFKMIDA